MILILGKSPNLSKGVCIGAKPLFGCFGLSFEEYYWLDWFCVMFVKGKCWVFKGNAVKNLLKPLFLFLL